MAEKEFIEREAALLSLTPIVKRATERNRNIRSAVNQCVDAINFVPAADVRPVVLCKDCRNDCHCMIQDFMEDYGVTHDDQSNFFCGYGEREES
jgi:hypothetical protein